MTDILLALILAADLALLAIAIEQRWRKTSHALTVDARVRRAAAAEQPPVKAEPQPTDLVTPAPMIGDVTLWQWILYHHPLRSDALSAVVAEFYRRAADVPEVLSYFAPTIERGGMEALQLHFTRALSIVADKGLTYGTLRAMEKRHGSVRDEDNNRITYEVYDYVISVLVGILVEQGVPREGIDALGRTIAPLRDAIAE